MEKIILMFLLLSGLFTRIMAQEAPYFEFLPIGDDPNLGYKTSMVKYEKILFEANPTMRFGFYNSIYKKLIEGAGSGQAWYVSFRPQLRMYTDNSLPVRTPSYRILLGYQRVWRHKEKNLFALSIESGHYSNGQDGGAFTEKYPDGSAESEATYNKITSSTNLSAILNRRSGNFSTDLTEFIINYRFNKLGDYHIPLRTHSVKLGMLLYHDYLFGLFNIGGYTENDIRIYGRWRTTAGYQFIRGFKGNKRRYAFSENMEIIYGAHPWVEPFRLETTATLYPFPNINRLGFFANYTWGHDNYNYRFVDSGGQFFLGVTWSIFPPFSLDKPTLQ